MRVILKEDVENLGRKGDIVNVAPGYGRNYLIPKKIAIRVTSSNMKMIEIERQALMKKLEKERASHQEFTEKLNEIILTFQRRAGEKDVIFGSVSSSDIKDALHERGFEIDKKKILMEEPIKRLGNFTVPIKIFHEDRAEIKVEVIKEEEAKKKEEIEGSEEAEEKTLEAETREKEQEIKEEKIEEEESLEMKQEEAEPKKAKTGKKQSRKESGKKKDTGDESHSKKEKSGT